MFDWPTLGVPGPARNYDVARDGKRFLMISEGAVDASSKAAPTALSVAINWLEELKEKLPEKDRP